MLFQTPQLRRVKRYHTVEPGALRLADAKVGERRGNIRRSRRATSGIAFAASNCASGTAASCCQRDDCDLLMPSEERVR